MSLLYTSNFSHQEGECKKTQEFNDLNRFQYNQDQHHLRNSGLTRYRSAPSSFLDTLLNGTTNECEEDYQYNRSSSPEMEEMLSRFVSACNGSAESNPQNMQDYGVKQEILEDSKMVNYPSLGSKDLGNNNGNSNFNVMSSMVVENSSMEARKMSTDNGCNLVRQSSSPAGFFSNLGVDNGFSVTKEASGFQVSNGLNNKSNPQGSNHVNLSSGQRLLPQISEIGDENPAESGSTIGSKRQYMNFANNSWDDSSSRDFKRSRDNDGNGFSALSTLGNQNGNSGNQVNSLTHHLSLPRTAKEMATLEKFLQFQGSVPCKIRAKRGFATHPRSIAERVRRTRISERMRKLQDLFPNMDKQTNTADMLDLAVEYIKDLQTQVKTLMDTKAMCACSSKQKKL